MYPSGLHLWDKILDATPEWLTFALIILAIAAAYVGIIAGTILLFLYACPPTRNKWREWRLFSFLAGIAVLFVTVAVRLSNN